jgi:5-methylcytosine-specific restriction endonuclease McrA
MPRLKNDVPNSTRTKVLTAQECAYCGDLLGPFEVDHVRPLSRGGDNQRSNLACACVSCNTQKSNLLLHEWRQWRTANGMTWPPVASHGTEPVHYRDGCQVCIRRQVKCPNWQVTPAYLTRRNSKAGLYVVGAYQCGACGHQWRCSHFVDNGYYSDCPCNYCVTCRIEAAS